MSPQRCCIHCFRIDLAHWLGAEPPDSVSDAARAALREGDPDGQLRGALVHRFGADLCLHLTTFAGDFAHADEASPFARSLALNAARAAAAMAGTVPAGARFAEALDLHPLDFPFTERGAEPIFVARSVGAGWGFFNRALFNLFFNPDKGSGRRIEGNDYRAIVESIADLRAGRAKVRTYEFGPGQGNELLALVADPDEWRLSEVYAVRGRFAEGKSASEPAARVGGGRNPVLIGRGQSGLPAVGEFTQAVGEFYFGPGGPGDGYRVGLLPVALAAMIPTAAWDGLARVAAYAYQSYDHGRIPADDVVDVFVQNPPETRFLQRHALRLVRQMIAQGEFEPYLNAETAIRRAEEAAHALASRFQPIPDGDDPMMTAANRRAAFTVSDIKADAGGRVGHTSPPRHFAGVARASLEEAKAAGLILGTSEFLAVGDDGHLLMSHTRGADCNAVHLFAYRTFFRQVWVAEVLGYRWYGLGQDLVGDASAGKKTEELAGLTDEFLTRLAEYLPETEQRRHGELRAAFEQWRRGNGRLPAPPFAGNVSGQGPGFAELPMPAPGKVGLLAIDKAGPSAFNLPLWEALQGSRQDGSLAAYLAGAGCRDAVLEAWDVERHRRIFLDLATEADAAQRLLGATDKFNVKRIWSRADGWDASHPEASLRDVLLAASTEKLAVITGGEYRGKDDPVLLAVEPLADALNRFFRDRFYLTQGDGRGSHNMFPIPLALGEAVATVNSRAVAISVLLSLDARGEIRGVRDVFADPSFEEARERGSRLNKEIWDAQGGNFSPVGVGAAKVEPSYPLAKMIAAITAEGSPFEARRPEEGAAEAAPEVMGVAL